jgi:AcrR family transcriptional regulator
MPDTPDAADRVLAAAAELFAEHGYRGTTTRAIAERAGVNEVTIFRRFTSKAGIVRAIGQQIASRSAGAAAREAPHPEDTPATLAALARQEIASAAASGGLALRLALDARSIPEVAEVVGAGLASNTEGLIAYLAARQEAGDLRRDIAPDLLAEAFFALTSSLVIGRILLGAPAPGAAERERLAAQAASLFWSGAKQAGGP